MPCHPVLRGAPRPAAATYATSVGSAGKGSRLRPVPYRRMRDTAFRRSQEAGVRLPHIAPINALVDELREEGRGWVPYVAPLYGGINAELLSILRDPGPMTHADTKGSGFLCLENDDAAAERFATLVAEAGIAPERMVPWNAYPWYINRKPNASELAAGLEPLRRASRTPATPPRRHAERRGRASTLEEISGALPDCRGTVCRASDVPHIPPSLHRDAGRSRSAAHRPTAEVRRRRSSSRRGGVSATNETSSVSTYARGAVVQTARRSMCGRNARSRRVMASIIVA